ncbi:MAG: hypothetical protein ACK4ZJ_16345, partial [Allorhizobium sp.]
LLALAAVAREGGAVPSQQLEQLARALQRSQLRAAEEWGDSSDDEVTTTNSASFYRMVRCCCRRDSR